MGVLRSEDGVRALARMAGSRSNSIIRAGFSTGAELDSLRFCFETVRCDTLAAGAELVVHRMAGFGRCPAC